MCDGAFFFFTAASQAADLTSAKESFGWRRIRFTIQVRSTLCVILLMHAGHWTGLFPRLSQHCFIISRQTLWYILPSFLSSKVTDCEKNVHEKRIHISSSTTVWNQPKHLLTRTRRGGAEPSQARTAGIILVMLVLSCSLFVASAWKTSSLDSIKPD